MKKIFRTVMGGVLLFSLSMSLISCDDVLGEWTKPTPTPITPNTNVTATSLAITDQLLRLEKATPQAITFTVAPANATITWKSDNEAVATVDAEGKITPIKAGEVTITAESGNLSATVPVKVYDEIYDINTSSGDVTIGLDEVCLINGDKDTPENKSILIGKGAKVTLNGINITQQITCDGDATIILADGSENKVTGTDNKAGIRIGEASTTTLTIDAETAGDGQLTAKGGTDGAGIGTDDSSTGGDIEIKGGTVNATGGAQGAGIGTGSAYSGDNTCGKITINGGKVTAQGGYKAAGIGTGLAYTTHTNTCGDITITDDVTSVTATKGSDSSNSIGCGVNNSGTQVCGTITINDVATGPITLDPYTYPTAP